MNTLEKLNRIFCDVFSVEESALNSEFDKCNIEGWAEDILEFTSYDNVKKVLAKYEIEL